MKLSLVVPCYNEEANVKPFFDEVNKVFKNKVEDFNKVCNLSEILVEKKTKKGIKEVDIKNLISSCKFEKIDDKIIMKLTCAAGSEENLNPDLLMKAFEKYIDNCDISYYSIHRNQLVFPVEYEF